MSQQTKIIKLENRALLALKGADKKSFLQAIITNDIENLNADTPLYAALLTPQGKYLFDFILSQDSEAETIFIDCEAERKDTLKNRLTMYKLRADVSIADVSENYDIWSVIDGEEGFVDPRHTGLGRRAYLKKGQKPNGLEAEYGDYDKLRLQLAIPDGARDIEVEKRPILEARFEALNGVNFTKGCYVGQEVTARMKHRNAVRKQMYAIKLAGNAPEFGTLIYSGDKKAGHILSSLGKQAMALIKNEYIDSDAPLTIDGLAIELIKPKS